MTTHHFIATQWHNVLGTLPPALTIDSGDTVTIHAVPAGGAPAAHGAPKASALRTPSHLAAGWGAFHRLSPSGGAANGMPLNTRTDA